jgi:hypothetical protein
LNYRVADTAPVFDTLILDVKRVKAEAERVMDENRKLKKKVMWSEVLVRTIYVFVSLAAALTLGNFIQVDNGVQTAILFSFLFVLLLVPTEKIHQLSAAIKGVKAKLTMK